MMCYVTRCTVAAFGGVSTAAAFGFLLAGAALVPSGLGGFVTHLRAPERAVKKTIGSFRRSAQAPPGSLTYFYAREGIFSE